MNGRPEYAMDFGTFNRAMAEGASAARAYDLALQSLPSAPPAPRTRSIVRRMALILALGFAVSLGALGASIAQPDAAAPTQRVEEDSAGWNCHTMGNRVCGSQTEGRAR